MNMRSFAMLALLGGLLLSGLSQARDLDQDEALRLRREGIILPFEQMMKRIEQHYPNSTLLEAELEEEDGVLVYEVEILTPQGVVRELELDARDGRVLKDEEDD